MVTVRKIVIYESYRLHIVFFLMYNEYAIDYIFIKAFGGIL